MTTFTRILLALTLLSTTLTASAFTKENPSKGHSNLQIISIYLDAITAGNPEFNKYLFAPNFEYTNVGLSITKYTKKQYCEFLEHNRGLTFNCTTSQKIVSSDDKTCIAKIFVKFETFTRIDYVTLVKNANSWKISKVITTYP